MSYVGIGLSDPKGPTNVGGVLRAVGCYQADEVFYTGTRYARSAKFNTDTKRVNQHIPLIKVDSFLTQKPDDVALVCVDLIEGATPLPEFEHPEKALYVFGPEDGTISQALIDKADAVVYVPTVGCMNLAASANVVLYDRLSKGKILDTSVDLIKASRDNNNRVKVR